MIERAFAVQLSIPDNEAYTALTTLQRLGIDCARVVRADIHVFGVEDDSAANLVRIVPTIAAIYNPNKHRLLVLDVPRPNVGEAWVTGRELPEPRTTIALGGIRLPGVSTMMRATSWRLLDERGENVSAELLDRAVGTLLCNPSFQRAIR